ncbi:unnamed protein product [Lactuca virosa]|uniref:Uncharacterized protein n=1 Tax=Lactuca virosa TaxID=75947 RepID=A0AAU9MJN6_9ASTR|nr:unnamed protein product [Lactuca virosa]
MANTPFLLESTFDLNPLLQQTFHFPPLRSFLITFSSGDNNAFKSNYTPYKMISHYPKIRTKCFFMIPKPKGENSIGGNSIREVKDLKASGVNEVIWRSIKNVVKALQKPVTTGVLLGLLLLYDHHHGCVALAASGGVGPAFGVGAAVGHDLGFCAIMMILGSILAVLAYRFLTITDKISVLKLQVGLSDTGKSLQTNLSRIVQITDHNRIFQIDDTYTSRYASTYNREDLSCILQETTLALLRHPEYCISGYSSASTSLVYNERSIEKVENLFDQLSIEERGKFDVDTLVNVNNIRMQRTINQRNKDFHKEYIVITIIVAAKGGHKLPPINSSTELKEALQKLATIPLNSVEAVVVFLTPQNENDTLMERKFLENYSLLRPL